jgi:hypothetical protein
MKVAGLGDEIRNNKLQKCCQKTYRSSKNFKFGVKWMLFDNSALEEICFWNFEIFKTNENIGL